MIDTGRAHFAELSASIGFASLNRSSASRRAPLLPFPLLLGEVWRVSIWREAISPRTRDAIRRALNCP